MHDASYASSVKTVFYIHNSFTMSIHTPTEIHKRKSVSRRKRHLFIYTPQYSQHGLPEGNGIKSPLSNGPGFVHLCGVEVEGHVLDPQGRVVRIGQKQTVKVLHALWGSPGVQEGLLSLDEGKAPGKK